MTIPRMWRHLVAGSIAAVLLVCAAFAADDSGGYQPPQRPDMTNLTPPQAKAAAARYRKELAVWQKAEDARDEAWEKAQTEKVSKAKAAARTPAKAATQSGPQWQQKARACGLDAHSIALLNHDGVVIAGPEFKQSFSGYGPDSPRPFITTDSLLNGFDVLLEATLKKYELERAISLRTVLEATWRNLGEEIKKSKVSRTEIQPYVHQLALILGPALRLLDSDISLGDTKTEKEINATVETIVEAKKVGMLPWMGSPDPAFQGIDFQSFTPVGFYADDPMLSDYFRALRWLQRVPFRADRSLDVGAYALLNCAEPWNRYESLNGWESAGEEIWGKPDETDIASLLPGRSHILDSVAKNGGLRKALESAKEDIVLLSRQNGSLVSDRLRLHDGDATPSGEALLVIFSPAVLPDSEFLSELAETEGLKKPFWPNGLEIASWMGSDFALDQLKQSSAKNLAAAIKARLGHFKERPFWNNSMVDFYYDTLNSLFDKPDPAAPKFMNSVSWKRKTVQTVLAGWMQLRHAWDLQAKEIVSTTGLDDLPPAGFVEPNEEFFLRMEKLESEAIRRFQEADVFGDRKSEQLELMYRSIRFIDRMGLAKADVAIGDAPDINIMARVTAIQELMMCLDPQLSVRDLMEIHGERSVARWKKIRGILQTRIDGLRRGDHFPPLRDFVTRYDPGHFLFRRWESLQSLTSTLGEMVQKELRGADWNSSERKVIQHYKSELGEVMGYLSSTVDFPKDDAPKWVTVYDDPNADRMFAAAIGRPRSLYVLYPWKGQRYLCRGVVMPYYEYTAKERLTDAEWKQRLDSAAAPKQPAWVQPILQVPVKTAKH